ncbi:MDR family MFS transporter [Haloimpatiens sp. FM7330]|uniref:MDR family MFS transporter n=1 Tax=Haloimpatiens sp. FM7330 TaxID=3298610 RepID=UPI0036398F5E
MKKIKELLSPYKGLPKEIYILFISKIINALGCFVGPLMTLILTEKIGMTKEMAGLYMSISGFLFMPTGLIGGKLADTIGRKKVIVIFEGLSAIFYIICGLMQPSLSMVYVLMVAGAFMGFAGPAHDSLIADLTEPKNRNAAYALSYMGWNIGFAVGPIIGGLLFHNHLSWVFIGDALTALIALSLIVFFIKETIHLTHEEITDESRKFEKREEGSIFKVLAKRPILIYFAIIIFGYNFVYNQWGFMMPIHVNEIYGSMGAKYYGYLASFNGIVVMFFTPIITKISSNIKNIKNVIYGGIFYAVGFGMLGIVNTLPFFFVSIFVFTIGEIILSISVTPFVVNHTPSSHRGRMSGILPMIMGIGYIVSPMVMGKALMYISIEKCWLILGAVAIISAFFMKKLDNYEEGKSDTENVKVCSE